MYATVVGSGPDRLSRLAITYVVRLRWPWCKVAGAEIQTYSHSIMNLALYDMATSALGFAA